MSNDTKKTSTIPAAALLPGDRLTNVSSPVKAVSLDWDRATVTFQHDWSRPVVFPTTMLVTITN